MAEVVHVNPSLSLPPSRVVALSVQRTIGRVRLDGAVDEHIRRTIATYDRIARDYRVTATAELRAWEEGSMRLFRQLLPGSRVLVPGCGDGRDSRFLSSIGLEVRSFDLSEGMLTEARNQDPARVYEKRGLRDIARVSGTYDGVFAAGCLYHLSRSEFTEFLRAAQSVLSTNGVLYLRMKLGTGEEFRVIPRAAAPGGSEARRLLRGERFYTYYSHEELLILFRDYTVTRYRPLAARGGGQRVLAGAKIAPFESVRGPS
jgi:SAM-dependent methyltransferase